MKKSITFLTSLILAFEDKCLLKIPISENATFVVLNSQEKNETFEVLSTNALKFQMIPKLENRDSRIEHDLLPQIVSGFYSEFVFSNGTEISRRNFRVSFDTGF
jgi:hypothetical protein